MTYAEVVLLIEAAHAEAHRAIVASEGDRVLAARLAMAMAALDDAKEWANAARGERIG